jgi:predicted small metal-binding protein
METVLQCDCGYEVRAHDEAELIARVQQHALEAHRLAFSADEVLEIAFRAELDEPDLAAAVVQRLFDVHASEPGKQRRE